ncbi:Zn(II)2Cys6 transcription factor [Aspergillus niger CBS 101883]|uniref:Zn(2)-C6 fungal-type domain-containing protein n=1 Tax=Aspergillus niger ATCC 13496 TaxID=1353008 RepID=A0A370BWZ7_ASPNG|nr:hypothetical protein ANI_1_2790024 [Aspergillus niger CBS 513.88]XP_025449273.1 uncharacterized protein BO96DRAFT_488276 [Aspergillus niger CBS 101883]PYH51218.1 hypothetical protein BO96DRAFT_488276 [Aspergillus niger CBS 101883]RDH20003.1 hypothetical protein M747DRAFT_280759 [Aspergillus niger ATCC 13496]|eukprot:XP_001399967.2 hypothetical protein ANI_1_2790024 [Aspergillus niger CBS 513.88]
MPDGCLRCKQRRIKCDETLPVCNQCTRKRFECPGYKRPLKWSSKYEVGRSGNNSAVLSSSEQVLQRIEPVQPLRPILFQSTVPDDATRSLPVQTDVQPAQNETAVGSDQASISAANSSPPKDIWIPSTMVGNDCGELWTGTILAEPTLSTQKDDDAALLRHYFSNVCRVNSCFDSHKNFFRAEVGSLISSRPLIHYCVLSMSAAHLTARQRDMLTITLRHRTEALSCLKARITQGVLTQEINNGSPLDNVAEILIGSILLGMTEGWHDPTQLGVTHLRGARTLFRKWITTVPACCPRTRTMITGIMSYWEAVASFVHNQSLDSISYLMPFSFETCHVYVNPWTGICTPLFIHLAQIGILTRQRSLARQLPVGFWGHVGPDMLERAKAIEDALQSYRTLSIHQIEDTADSRTPVDHLQRIASIYRLVGLLQLYMTFPELHGAHSVDFSLTHSILGLATNVLTTIGVLPHTSGVYCLLTIPLIIAGSALQLPCFSSDVPTSMLQQDTYLFWRNFVRERVKTVQEIVGLVTIGRAQKILDKVWFLADMRRAAEDPDQEWEYIQWTEVMSSENLESIFG